MINRVRDITVACFLTLLSSPLWVVTVLAILAESKGNPFYLSPRIGLHGKQFRMLKFRTMFRDGDLRLNKLEHDELQSNFKITNDPRVTGVGRWLRRYSLDELPQLVNVVKGDMTLVGPRPKLPQEIELYGPSKEELLSVLPGMTGYWQIHRTTANSDTAMREMDLYYVRHKCLGLDAMLLLQTIKVVFSRVNY